MLIHKRKDGQNEMRKGERKEVGALIEIVEHVLQNGHKFQPKLDN